jgi:hypothetical protein
MAHSLGDWPRSETVNSSSHSTHAHSAEAEVARVSRQSTASSMRAETAAIMIALRCRPTRVSCRCLAYVEATPNA